MCLCAYESHFFPLRIFYLSLTLGGGREVQEGGTYVNLWLIPVDVWQKPTQYCKAITLQLKINNKSFNSTPHAIPALCFTAEFLKGVLGALGVKHCLFLYPLLPLPLVATSRGHARSLQSCPTLCNPTDYGLEPPPNFQPLYFTKTGPLFWSYTSTVAEWMSPVVNS